MIRKAHESSASAVFSQSSDESRPLTPSGEGVRKFSARRAFLGTALGVVAGVLSLGRAAKAADGPGSGTELAESIAEASETLRSVTSSFVSHVVSGDADGAHAHCAPSYLDERRRTVSEFQPVLRNFVASTGSRSGTVTGVSDVTSSGNTIKGIVAVKWGGSYHGYERGSVRAGTTHIAVTLEQQKSGAWQIAYLAEKKG